MLGVAKCTEYINKAYAQPLHKVCLYSVRYHAYCC
jgi:hypothetical protein